MRVALGAGAVLGVAGLILVGGALWGLWSFASIDRVDLDLADSAPTEPRNFLVVGSDSRAEVDEDDPGAGGMLGPDAPGGQRADSLMIARVDPDSDRIDLLSVPRDLWIPVPGTDEHQRINATYSESAQAVVDAVSTNLGIPVHHYVEVDFGGFSELVDSLGGVPMYFPEPVRDRNSGLFVTERGCRVLNGHDGLAFARARHLEYRDDGEWVSDGTGDIGRMNRQQLLTRAALAKAQDLGLGDVGKLRGLVEAAVDAVSLDSRLGAGDLIELGQKVADLDPQRVQTHSLPVEPMETSGGAAVVTLDQEAAPEVLAVFRGETDAAPVTTTTTPPPAAEDVTVDVLNGSGVDGEARRVSFVLDSDGGFVPGVVDNAADEETRTVVHHPEGSEEMGELVAAWLGPDPEVEEDPDLPEGVVRVVLGEDFERVGEPAEEPATTTTSEPAPGASADPSELAGPATTTTTTTPGWLPEAAPEGVSCG